MTATPSFPTTRLRRLRHTPQLRNLVREVHLDLSKLILPLFIKAGSNIKNPIASMPGHCQWSVDNLNEPLEALLKSGIKNIILFGIPAQKDPLGKESCADDGVIQQAIKQIKKIAPELLVISDVCFCEYTDHGHCGFVVEKNHGFEIDNDKSLAMLAQQAVSHAQAGADIVAPSANMDGMVGAIRNALDTADFKHIPILSYAVKYASSMYGPFRLAAEGAPKFGDRASYQMDFANRLEGLRECELDITEGADMLMVKPAHTYLDVICRVKETYPTLPLCAYHTSGEFAMLKTAAEKGWVDEKKAAFEVLTAIHRAGADFIITYYAQEVAQWLTKD